MSVSEAASASGAVSGLRLWHRTLARFNTCLNRLLGQFGEPAAATLVRLAPKGLQPPHVGMVSAKRMGARWQLDLRSNLEWRLFLIGTYEAATLRVAHRLIRPGDVVVDVGANIGTFCVPLASRRRDISKVIAVEPAPDVAATLAAHVSANGLSSRIQIVRTALGSEVGRGEIRAPSDEQLADTGLRSMVGHGPVVATVPVSLGDALVETIEAPVGLLKIDVEGSEIEVLNGFGGTFRNRPPRNVIVEISEQNQS